MKFKGLYILLSSLLITAGSIFAQAGGETCDSATVIPGIPFIGTGNTSNADDDYYEICADAGNNGGKPDHVYKFTTDSVALIVEASLCEAGTDFNAQLYVFKDSCNTSPIACQEDGCTPPGGFWAITPVISGLQLDTFTTYYFVIDGKGWFGDGDYEFHLENAPGYELPDSSEIPLVYINTFGNPIPDEPKITGMLQVINNGPGNLNYSTDPYNEYDGFIGIERRGASSSMFPKKGYGVETRDSAGENNNVPLFGMPTENDWVMHAPYSDKSLLRNYLSYYMGAQILEYSPRTQFCEVILNQKYEGVYLWVEKIKRDKGRVAIAKLDSNDLAGDSLTGGYVIKIDKFNTGNEKTWNSNYQSNSTTPKDIPFQFHDPEDDEIQPAQESYIENYVHAFESALAGSNYQDSILGYRAYIDDTSFLNFFLLNEITRNVDGYRISTFLYKNRDDKGGKLKAGPPWDFNLGFGNADYCDGGDTSGWAYQFNQVCGSHNQHVPFWWERLLTDPTYTNKLRCRWEDLRMGKWHTDTIHDHIDSVVNAMSNPIQRNFDRWDVLGKYVWPNNYVGNTYPNEVQFLKDWISGRMNWLDQNIPGQAVNCTPLVDRAPDAITDIRLFPNPFSERFYLEFMTTEAEVDLSLVDLQGREIWSGNFQSNGFFRFDSQNSRAISALNTGMYILNVKSENSRQSMKIIKR